MDTYPTQQSARVTGMDGPDGPIREPGDDVPAWHDVYTAEELATALEYHAAQLAHRHGYYDMAAELNSAAEALRDLQAREDAQIL